MRRYRADLVDAVRERWRYDEGLTGGPGLTPTIRVVARMELPSTRAETIWDRFSVLRTFAMM